jgi:hypothetical protein
MGSLFFMHEVMDFFYFPDIGSDFPLLKTTRANRATNRKNFISRSHLYRGEGLSIKRFQPPTDLLLKQDVIADLEINNPLTIQFERFKE